MENRTRNRAFGMLLSAKRHTRYIGILACLALVVAFGVTMGLRRNGRAATVTQTVLDCHAASGVAHSHNADCYDADGNLVCPLQERELHVHDDACYDEEGNLVCGKEEVTEEHVHGAGCFKTVTVTVDDPEPEAEAPAEDEGPDYAQAEAEATPMPSQIFEEKVDLEGKNKDASDDLIVRVEAPEGALPKGTTMRVSPITAKKYIDSAKNEVKDKTKADVEAVQAVDITFIHDGKEVEPEKNVHVSMRYADVQYTQDKAIEIVHVDDKYNADIVGKKNEQTMEDEVTFESDRFSVYAMVITTQHIDSNGNVYDVTVSYGPEAKIPDGSWLRVNEIASDDAEYDRARNAVLADKLARGEDVDLEDFNLAALDISIIDPSGNEIEPSATVKVNLKVKSLPEVEDLAEVAPTMEVQHHVATGKKVIVETVAGGETSASFSQATDASVISSKRGTAVDPDSFDESAFAAASEPEPVQTTFATEVFSTFTITWRSGGRTVTVHYVDENGTELNIKNPVSTYPNLTANSDSPAFLIYDIDGYEYSYTYRNTNTNANRIAPLLAKNNDNRWMYNVTRNTYYNNVWYTGTELNNGDNIYVVYKKKADVTTGGTAVLSDDEVWPDEENPARKPQFGKSSTNNGNGTNKISLTIAGPEKPVEKSTPADVIVIFDNSGSMDEAMSGSTRLQLAKNATNTMAQTLLANSGVRMALISFSTTAQEAQGFTSDYNTFRSAVNRLDADGGTNWEQALQLANQMEVRSDAATYVVFVTDGDPTFRVSRGDVVNSGINSEIYTSNSFEYYRNNSVFGQGNADSQNRNFNYAVKQVSAINGANKNFYAIGISNEVTKVRNLTTQGGVAADHAFIASDSTAMENAFKAITESIKSNLGFGDLEITDGITALANAEMKVMQSVDPNSFKYYRYGGENNKYGADYAHKTEWTTREADGCAAATYTESDGAVHWDMGETFQLENNVTYVVEFDVWPSQAAYDLVADLNNGIKTYDQLTAAEKAQVVEVTAPTETTTGTYALKTNTDKVQATYNQTTKTGETVTIHNEEDALAQYKEGDIQNMALDADPITIEKTWNNEIDGREADSIQLHVTKEGANYLTVELSKNNGWKSGNEYISAGFITTTADGRYNVREAGHNYTVTEPDNYAYYWDLTADIYRPMVIDGTLHVLTKTTAPTGTEGRDYFVIEGVAYQMNDGANNLVATNDRRSVLDLKKVVTKDEHAVDDPDPNTTFTYTMTVTDVNGDAVWFSAQDKSGATVAIPAYSNNVTAEIRDGSPTGYYNVPSGQEFTISIKADWNVRFLNLPTGTTYSINETGVGEGYDFVKAEAAANNEGTPGTVRGAVVSGTIDKPNNIFSATYTNKWKSMQIEIVKVDDEDNGLGGASFDLAKWDGEAFAAVTSFTSKAAEGEKFYLGQGTYCLTETAAPAGYNILSNEVYFNVKPDGTVELCDENGDPEAAEYDNASVKNVPEVELGTVIVSNTPGAELPMTGGPGNALFNILGSAIATAAILTYGLLSRRTSEGRSWV